MWTAPFMRFVFDEPPYGTSMPGAGAVHHINNGSVASIDHLVCTTKQGGRNFETERLRGLQIDLPPWRSRQPM